MKFEVESISDGRFLLVPKSGDVMIIADGDLGATLRKLANGADPKPIKRRGAPRGPRKALGKGIAEAGKAAAAGTEG